MTDATPGTTPNTHTDAHTHNSKTHNNIAYTHNNTMEMMAFVTKLKVLAKKKSSNVLLLFRHAVSGIDHGLDTRTDTYKDANEELFDLIVEHVASHQLLQTLGSLYENKGVEALKYIRNCFALAGNQDKERVAAQKYKEALITLTHKTSSNDLSKLFNDLHIYRNDLAGTDREIPVAMFCRDMQDMVASLSQEHKIEVRMSMAGLSEEERSQPGIVQSVLEGVMSSIAADDADRAKETKRAVMAVQEAPPASGLDRMAAAIKALEQRQKNNSPHDPCPDCGVRHPLSPTDKCHALLRSRNEKVPGWDKKSDEQKKRIDSRADDIRRLGPFKDRANGGNRGAHGGGSVNMATLTALMAMMQPGNAMRVARMPDLSTNVNSMTSTYGPSAAGRLLVDTGNLTGKHLIADKSLFSTLDEGATQYPVCVANNNIELSAGVGTCDLITIDDKNNNPNGRIILRDCAYCPTLGANLLCVTKLKESGWSFDPDNCKLYASNGNVYHLDDHFTFRAIPLSGMAGFTFVTRGKNGPTHIDDEKLSKKQLNELRLQAARLNDPPAEVLRDLHKTVDGTADILRKATRTNATSRARLLADGKQYNAPEVDDPVAKNPGDKTAMDHWSSTVTSYMGNTGLFACIDIHSGHFRLYPIARKSEHDKCGERYFVDAAHDGVKIPEGSVMYTDNEAIFTSRRFNMVTDKRRLLHQFSAEYEPWGNGVVESVNRYVCEHVVRALIIGGAPEELWDFAALDAEFLLNAIRTRNGVSVREAWCGKRRNLKRRRVLFCKMIARKPVQWRGSKLEDRGIECVYLGKARNKQGYYGLSEKYGLITTTNATWMEDEFPFKQGMRLPQNRRGGGGSGGASPGGGVAAPGDISLGVDDDDGHGDNNDDDGGSRYDDEDDDDDGGINNGLDAASPPSPPTPTDDNASAASGEGGVAFEEAGTPDVFIRRHNNDRALQESSSEPEHPSDSPTSSHDPDYAPASSATSDSASETPVRQPQHQHNTRSTRSEPLPQTVFSELDKHNHSAYCARLALHALMVGVPDEAIESVLPILCSASPGGIPDDYVPKPRDNVDEIEDDVIREAWKESDKKEFDGILKWAKPVKVKDLPKGVVVLGGTTQRVIKRDGRRKTRFCIQGFKQIWKMHYDRTHSPALMHASTRTLLATCASIGAKVDFADFTQAYTQADLDPSEWLYVKPPIGHDKDADGDDVVWLITKSLYGMKQAGRTWYMCIRKWTLDYRYGDYQFKQSTADPGVFSMKTDVGEVLIGLYVDDMIIGYTDEAARDHFMDAMAKEFKFTDQGKLTDVLGMQIHQNEECISISHENYITNLVETFLAGEANRKEHKTPACEELEDLIIAAIESTGPIDPELLAMYRSLVGALLYCAVTVRPDIAYAVGMLSRALNKPTKRLLDEAKRVLTYLNSTKTLGPRYVKNVGTTLYGMSDSGWSTRRSTSGFAFFYAGAVISALSKKQPTIAMSSTEAELMAACSASLEALFLRALLEDLGIPVTAPTDLYVDNKGAIDLSHDHSTTGASKHIQRRFFKIRELVDDAVIRVRYITSTSNIADIFTKPLSKRVFIPLRDKLLNLPRSE